MTGKLKVPELFCVIVLIYCSMIDNSWAKDGCVGRFVNPVTDVCWSCLLPIKIAGVNITGGDIDTLPQNPYYVPAQDQGFRCRCREFRLPSGSRQG